MSQSDREFDPKLSWNSSKDDIINDFYKPALLNCNRYQRLAGYFSSSTFANVANEILEFIESNGKIQLITSPQLSEKDKDIIEKSVLESEQLLSTIFLEDLKKDPDNLKLEFTKLMAYMLTNKIDGTPQLEIKIAIPTKGPGIYHQKIGILQYNDGQRLTFAGSVNETGMSWHENIENFTVFCSWREDDTNNQGVMDHQSQFNDLWNNGDDEVQVFDLPQAIKKHMLEIRPESDIELKRTIDKIKKIIREGRTGVMTSFSPKKSKIELKEYQNEAIQKWIENDFRGILEMATGTGKTFTAFGCINEIQKKYERTITIIACPQLHLIEQWKDETDNWNSNVGAFRKIFVAEKLTCNSNNPSWEKSFEQILNNFNIIPLGHENYILDHAVIFTTHKTLLSDKFIDKILKIKNVKKLLIIDEVHNITKNQAEKGLLEDYEFRLGLSATPSRHLDEEGTEILINYFNGIVYTLTLDKAIHDLKVLCQYFYYPYYVELTDYEMEKYLELTRIIAQIEEKKRKDKNYKKQGDFDPYLERSNLIANAENKYKVLEEILKTQFNDSLKNTLIYCTNNPSIIMSNDSPRQLEQVQKILTKHGITTDSVTWVDSTHDRLKILDNLNRGHFHCVTAVKCLDEGVDIPSIHTGIFMASSGNPKQFIQRRGRILRKDNVSGKTHADIYDILVIPPIPKTNMEFNLSQRKLAAKEFLRHKEFASIANNEKDAIEKIKNITNTLDISFDELDSKYIKNMQ